jgi:hypothetical protein
MNRALSLDLKRLVSRSQVPLHHPQTISFGCRANGIPPVTAVEPPQNGLSLAIEPPPTGLSTAIIASSGAYSPIVGVGDRVLFVALAVAFALRRGEPVVALAFAFGRRFAAALQQWKTTLLALCFRGWGVLRAGLAKHEW